MVFNSTAIDCARDTDISFHLGSSVTSRHRENHYCEHLNHGTLEVREGDRAHARAPRAVVGGVCQLRWIAPVREGTTAPVDGLSEAFEQLHDLPLASPTSTT
jgi:hypothetical protein